MNATRFLCTISEAIRKPFRTVAARSSSILTVMKRRAIAGTESVEHKVYVTDLDHSSTGCCTALIVLAVPTVPAMPGVRPLNHPAFRQRRKALRALWTRRDLDAPPGTMLRHPGVQSMVVILLIRKDRHETRKVVGRDVAEQERSCHPIIETGTGNEDGEQQPQRIDQEMPLAPFDFLAPVIPTLRAAYLGGLDRCAIDSDGARRGLAPRLHAGLLTQCLDHFCPCPIVAPLGTVVIDGAFGQQIMGQHIPLAATPVEIEQCIEYLPHVHRTRAPSPVALLGGWNQRCQYRPLLVRQIRRVFLSMQYSVNHSRALLC